MKTVCAASVVLVVAVLGVWPLAAAVAENGVRTSTSKVLTPFSAAAPPSENVRRLCSFEKEELEKKGFEIAPWTKSEGLRVSGLCESVSNAYGLLRRRHATDGEWALCEYYCRGNDLNGHPNRIFVEPLNAATAERLASYCHLLGSGYMGLTTDKLTGPDWSGFDFLCLDIFSGEGDIWFHVIIEGGGNTSPYARFHVRKGAETIAVPIGRYTDSKMRNHIDLKNIVSLHVIPETTEADGGEVYLDNLRLVRGAAPKGALEPCEEIGRDWGWAQMAQKHPPIEPPTFTREAGPCEKIGPLTLATGTSAGGFLNGHDKLREFIAVSAVDNKRLLVLSHAGLLASFDGGATWGSLDGSDTRPTKWPDANVGHGVGNDGPGGTVYVANSTIPLLPKGFAVDRLELAEGPECFKRFAFILSSCHGAIRPIGLQGITVRDGRWQFVGKGNAPMSIFDDYTHHCPSGFDLIRVAGGRLWAFLDHNGEGGGRGVRASYSDDHGLTWTASHRTRWIGGGPPHTYMSSFYVAPYKDQAALAADDGNGSVIWTYFDGKEWSAPVPIERHKVRSVFAVASWPEKADRLYALVARERKLTLVRLEGGKWGAPAADPVLDDGARGSYCSPRLSVSKDTLFCFWVLDFERGADGVAHSKIILRRYDLRTGVLAPEEELAGEQEPIFQLSVPHVSPPDYVALVWANSTSAYERYGFKDNGTFLQTGRGKHPLWLRFMKVPNPATK